MDSLFVFFLYLFIITVQKCYAFTYLNSFENINKTLRSFRVHRRHLNYQLLMHRKKKFNTKSVKMSETKTPIAVDS